MLEKDPLRQGKISFLFSPFKVKFGLVRLFLKSSLERFFGLLTKMPLKLVLEASKGVSRKTLLLKHSVATIRMIGVNMRIHVFLNHVQQAVSVNTLEVLSRHLCLDSV